MFTMFIPIQPGVPIAISPIVLWSATPNIFITIDGMHLVPWATFVVGIVRLSSRKLGQPLLVQVPPTEISGRAELTPDATKLNAMQDSLVGELVEPGLATNMLYVVDEVYTIVV
jgi:hypothetical protein